MRVIFFIIIITSIAVTVSLAPQKREIQAQEERRDIRLFEITYKVNVPQNADIADILWMKKAAVVAKESGIPYFNVLEHRVTKRFESKLNRELPTVRGIIELDSDPMRAEFDAQEIESLVLPDASF